MILLYRILLPIILIAAPHHVYYVLVPRWSEHQEGVVVTCNGTVRAETGNNLLSVDAHNPNRVTCHSDKAAAPANWLYPYNDLLWVKLYDGDTVNLSPSPDCSLQPEDVQPDMRLYVSVGC